MSFKISDFRNALGTGSRPNLFRVRVTPPAGISTNGFDFLCRASSLPAATLGLIEIPMNGGRRLKLGGDRTFAEWTTTVLNDENFSTRSNLELWQNNIVKTNYNLDEIGNRSVDDNDLLNATVDVYQLGANGEEVENSRYRLFNCWPSDISTIDLSYDTTDTVEEFTVTWSFDYFLAGPDAYQNAA